jgi:hypothetical protein
VAAIKLLTKAGRVKIAQDIKKSGMIASAIKQIVNTVVAKSLVLLILASFR